MEIVRSSCDFHKIKTMSIDKAEFHKQKREIIYKHVSDRIDERIMAKPHTDHDRLRNAKDRKIEYTVNQLHEKTEREREADRQYIEALASHKKVKKFELEIGKTRVNVTNAQPKVAQKQVKIDSISQEVGEQKVKIQDKVEQKHVERTGNEETSETTSTQAISETDGKEKNDDRNKTKNILETKHTKYEPLESKGIKPTSRRAKDFDSEIEVGFFVKKRETEPEHPTSSEELQRKKPGNN